MFKRILKKGVVLATFLAFVLSYGSYIKAEPYLTKKDKKENKEILKNTSTQVLADQIIIPWEEDFEDGASGFSFTEGASVNKWYIGDGASCDGTSALYISNDGGVTNAYTNKIGTTSQATKVHAYIDILIPEDIDEVFLDFDYKAAGDHLDFLRVWMVPATYQPVAGTEIDQFNSGGFQINEDLEDQETCAHIEESLWLKPYAGTVQRLVFEWQNDNFGDERPPAGVIDNISLTRAVCPKPILNQVAKNPEGQFVLSWEPVGNETQWDLVVQPVNSGEPTTDTEVISVAGTPQYVFNPTPGVTYEFYVRAMCSEDSTSLWQGPEPFSDFSPPTCSDLYVAPLDFDVNRKGEYVACDGNESYVLDLEASFDATKFRETTTYSVESIDYAPPFPFTGGVVMDPYTNQTWSPIINFPFQFCFFGNSYDKALVSQNGVMSFTINDPIDPWNYLPNEGATFILNGQIPNTNFIIRNAIYGVFQRLAAGRSDSETTQINYQVLGTYPCRAFVLSYNDVPVEVPLGESGCAGEEDRQTYQIVIYELTNIIEVYVKNRTSCPDANDGGLALIGIQNYEGTEAYTPPNRNTGTWEAHNEAWRFSPNGAQVPVEFAWYMNGEKISEDLSHRVTISGKNKTYTFEARVTLPGCEGGEEVVLNKNFTVKIGEEVVLSKPEDIIYCIENLAEEDLPRITDNYDEIMKNIATKDNFDVTYYKSEADAAVGTNPIENPQDYFPETFPETIYVRVENNQGVECFATTSFNLKEGEKAELQVEDVLICNTYILPQLPNGQEYLYYERTDLETGEMTTVENPTAGKVLKAGDYKVFVKATSPDGCYEIKSFMIQVQACIVQKGISPNGDGANDFFDLTDYWVESLKIYNRYGTEVYHYGSGYINEWSGQDQNGKDLPTGTYFYVIKTPFEELTGYVYIAREII